MKNILLVVFLSSLLNTLLAQDVVYQTFKDTRIINTHSVETLAKRKLDIRIGHRFGDLAGSGGGWPTFYGLESAADVFIGGEYGISDRFTVGISRTKGAGDFRQLVNPIAKYRLLRQTENERPISLTLLGVSTFTTMQSSNNPEAINYFEKFSHRIVYAVQVLVGKKFSERFSAQITPGYLHRNIVPFGENNGMFTLGLASRIQLTRAMGLILDATIPFDETRTTENGFYIPIGVGFEFDTGGHVFQVNLTNARGMMETDYIPYTESNWGEGQFRLGFTISRLFNL